MCDFDGQLIAWLDGELPESEAAHVERHLKMCAECRKGAEVYKRTSIAFNAYCDAVSAVVERRRTLGRKMVVLGAGAVAALLVLAFLAQYPRALVMRPQSHVSDQEVKGPRPAPAKAVTAPTGLSQALQMSGSFPRRVRPRHIVAAVQAQDANLFPAGPAVQIAIPAEAVLPPGAAVAGENFVVDLSIAPDGSAEGIRLRPQLAGLERRGTQP